jgi:hypothetical protein
MICIQCGAHNEDVISYCRQCGTNLQAVRSALLGVPPPSSQPLPALYPKAAPLITIMSGFFGFLSFSALLGIVIAIIAIASDPSSRIDTGGAMALAALVAVTGTIGIVFIVRMFLRMATSLSAMPAPPQTASTGSRTLDAAPHAAALPPPRQPMSVVEHTTANLPNYVRPSRNTAE